MRGGRSREQRLVEAYVAMRRERFDWGEGNCGLTAATLGEAFWGVDFGAEFRPLCVGPLAAMRCLRDAGGFSGILAGLGMERLEGAAFARRGDFVVARWESAKGRSREALGIVVDGRAAFADADGLKLVPVLGCAEAWRPVEGNSEIFRTEENV